MKTTNKIFKALVMLLIGTSFLTAQNQIYRFHVDQVYPSSTAAYEKISKNLAALAKENKENEGWNVLWTSDNKVISITPVKAWGDMGNEFMPNTLAKLGDKKFGEMFEEFANHYDNHYDYVLILNSNLSYMPEGMTVTPEGKNYRKNTLMYYKARDQKKIEEFAGKFKELHSKKGSKSHYRVYFSDFGNQEAYVLVARAAESPLEYEKQAEANRMLMGEDARKLWDELSQYITRTEYIEGYMRPDLSYTLSKS